MAIVHKGVAPHRCTFEIWDGDIDEAEIQAHLSRLAQDPQWPPGILNLVDLSTVRNISVPDPELVALLREGTVLENELRTALIVRPEWIAGDAPQYDEAAHATGVTAFSDVAAASAHLGVPLPVSLGMLEALRQSL
jgi:hypothetical protein